MNTVRVAFMVVLFSAGPAHAGCIKGAVVGGVGGHIAGHHGLAGAAVGCAIGHHMSVTKKRRLAPHGAATTHRH